MKLYEIEILKEGNKHKKIVRAKNLNTAQSIAIVKKWKIVNIKELDNIHLKKLSNDKIIIFF